MGKSRFDSRHQSIPPDKFAAQRESDRYWVLDEIHDGGPTIAELVSRWEASHQAQKAQEREREMNDSADNEFIARWLSANKDSLNKGVFENVTLPSGKRVRINGFGEVNPIVTSFDQRPGPPPVNVAPVNIRPISKTRDEAAASDLYLRLIERLGGSIMVPLQDMTIKQSDYTITTAEDYAAHARLVKVERNPRPMYTVPGPAQALFAFADQLDARAADAPPHEAGVYADVADEVRRNIRLAFYDIMSAGMLKKAEEANRIRTSAGTHKLPDQYWQEIPAKYVAVACDGRDGNANWYGYRTTELEYHEAAKSWAPTYEASVRLGDDVLTDIMHVGDTSAIPCSNPSQSLTFRPNHLE